MTAARAGSSAIRVIPAEARPFQGERAGLASRALAVALDCVVVVLILAALYAVWAGTSFLRHGRSFRFPTVSLASAITAATVVFVAYSAIGWATTGRTYGNRVLGLRIVDTRGRRLQPTRAVLRAFLSVIFPVGLAWCAVSSQSRSVQDLIMATSVIYDWDVKPQTEP